MEKRNLDFDEHTMDQLKLKKLYQTIKELDFFKTEPLERFARIVGLCPEDFAQVLDDIREEEYSDLENALANLYATRVVGQILYDNDNRGNR